MKNNNNSFKIKMIDMVRMIESFNKLVEAPLSISTSLKLMRMQELFVKEHDFYMRQEKKLIDEFGEIVEKDDTKNIEFKDGNFEKFSNRLKELQNTEIVVYVKKIKPEELKDNSGNELFLSANDLYKLRPILED